VHFWSTHQLLPFTMHEDLTLNPGCTFAVSYGELLVQCTAVAGSQCATT
jgi:hypothetical protein